MTDQKTQEERLRAAFNSIQEDIESLKTEISTQKEIILAIKDKLEGLLSNKSEKKDKIDFFYSSIGNEGVVNNQQQSTTIVNNQQTMINNKQPSHTEKEGKIRLEDALKDVDLALTQKLQSLTDREFSLFLAILELNEQGQETTYTDLADRLHLSESAVRGVANRLLSKGLPLTKHRFLHKKASIQVNPSFRELHPFQRILSLRHNQQNQTNLTQF